MMLRMGRPRLKLDEKLIATPWISAEEVARMLGCAPKTVLNRRREMGVVGRRQGKRGPDRAPRRKPGTGWHD